MTLGPSKCDPISLYMQLSQATHWEGIHLRSKLRRKDFIEPPNVVDPRLRRRMVELEELDRETRYRFEEEGRQDPGSWFYKRQAIDRR